MAQNKNHHLESFQYTLDELPHDLQQQQIISKTRQASEGCTPLTSVPQHLSITMFRSRFRWQNHT